MSRYGRARLKEMAAKNIGQWMSSVFWGVSARKNICSYYIFTERQVKSCLCVTRMTFIPEWVSKAVCIKENWRLTEGSSVLQTFQIWGAQHMVSMKKLWFFSNLGSKVNARGTALGFVSPKGLPISGFHVRSNMHAPCTHARPHDLWFSILNGICFQLT